MGEMLISVVISTNLLVHGTFGDLISVARQGKANAFHEEVKSLFGLLKVHVRLLPFPAHSVFSNFSPH